MTIFSCEWKPVNCSWLIILHNILNYWRGGDYEYVLAFGGLFYDIIHVSHRSYTIGNIGTQFHIKFLHTPTWKMVLWCCYIILVIGIKVTYVNRYNIRYYLYIRSHLQTTSIAISKESSTTTPGTPSVTDPNKLPHSDETMTGGFSNPPNLKLKPNKGNSVSGKRYNSSEQIPTNDDTRSNPKERVTMFALENRTKWSSTTKKSRTIWGLPTLSPITDVLLSHNSRMEEMGKKTVEQPTRYIIDYQ